MLVLSDDFELYGSLCKLVLIFGLFMLFVEASFGLDFIDCVAWVVGLIAVGLVLV